MRRGRMLGGMLTSAWPLKADKSGWLALSALCQKRTYALQQTVSLFDHHVGAGQQRGRHFERQRPGSAEINHKLELRWQLNRQVARFFALENATCIDALEPRGLVGVRSIAHQPPDRGKFTAEVEGSHPMPCRKHDDLRRTIEKKRIDSNGKGIDALLPEGCECRIDLGNGTRVEDYDLPADIGGRGPNVVQLSIDIRHIRIDENADGRC